MPGGLHDLERWNELVCEGAWGRWFARVGEKVRRAVDLEDWSAFHDSYLALMDLLRDVATPGDAARRPTARRPSRSCPATSTSASGARATFADEPGARRR